MWAYAAKVAVEYTTEDNNYMCQSMPSDWSGSLVNHGSFKDCLRNVGDDDCEVNIKEIENSKVTAAIYSSHPMKYSLFSELILHCF